NQGGVPRTAGSRLLPPVAFRTQGRERGARGPGQGHLRHLLGPQALPRVRPPDPRAPRDLGRPERARTEGPPGPPGRLTGNPSASGNLRFTEVYRGACHGKRARGGTRAPVAPPCLEEDHRGRPARPL